MRVLVTQAADQIVDVSMVSNPDEGTAESDGEEDCACCILETSYEVVVRAARDRAVLSRDSLGQALAEMLDDALATWEEQEVIGMTADGIDWILDRDGNVHTCARRRAQEWQRFLR